MKQNHFNNILTAILFAILPLLFLSFQGKAQLKIGMSPKAIMPSTVTASSSYSVIVWVKNKGNVSYSGKIHLKYGVDSTQTLTNIIQTKYDSISVNNFMPGDSVLKAFGETYEMPNAYRVNGNGSTVVIWPIIKTNPSATKDSLIRVVYVKPKLMNGINELWYQQLFMLYPNPTTDQLTFKIETIFDNLIPHKIHIYSVLGNYHEERLFQKNLSVEYLDSGVYYLELISTNGLKSKPLRLVKN